MTFSHYSIVRCLYKGNIFIGKCMISVLQNEKNQTFVLLEAQVSICYTKTDS